LARMIELEARNALSRRRDCRFRELSQEFGGWTLPRGDWRTLRAAIVAQHHGDES
jgi:hypothetical protein